MPLRARRAQLVMYLSIREPQKPERTERDNQSGQKRDNRFKPVPTLVSIHTMRLTATLSLTPTHLDAGIWPREKNGLAESGASLNLAANCQVRNAK
jgi:hypothetical protein